MTVGPPIALSRNGVDHHGTASASWSARARVEPSGIAPPPGQQPRQQRRGADVALREPLQRRGDQLLEPVHPAVLQAPRVPGDGGAVGALRGPVPGSRRSSIGRARWLGPDQARVGQQVGDDGATGDGTDGAHLPEHPELVEAAQGAEVEQRGAVAAAGQAQAHAVPAPRGRRCRHFLMQPRPTDSRLRHGPRAAPVVRRAARHLPQPATGQSGTGSPASASATSSTSSSSFQTWNAMRTRPALEATTAPRSASRAAAPAVGVGQRDDRTAGRRLPQPGPQPVGEGDVVVADHRGRDRGHHLQRRHRADPGQPRR